MRTSEHKTKICRKTNAGKSKVSEAVEGVQIISAVKDMFSLHTKYFNADFVTYALRTVM